MHEEMATAVGAGSLVTSAVLAALIGKMAMLGILSTADVVDVYENALLSLETQQGAAPTSQEVFRDARELIEQHLRAVGSPNPKR